MADEPLKQEPYTPPAADKPPGIRSAMMQWDAKIVLAFFLTVISALLFVFVALLIVYAPTKLDGGTIGLMVGILTLFVKQAMDASGYQYGSSAGSDRKDVQQAKVADRLAEKVAAPIPVPIPVAPVAPVTPWWDLLTDDERTAITAGARNDARVKLFMDTAAAGKATTDDLADLVSARLLTQDRASAIATA